MLIEYMDRLVISVIVPIYNVEKHLRQCLDSIVHQTYPYLEIILVNDGSTDDSGLICDEYAKQDSRIKVFHKDNGGVSSARNLGLKEATGRYFTFVDGDDWLLLDAYAILVSKLADTTDLLIFGYKSVYPDRQIDMTIRDLYELTREQLLELFYNGNYEGFLGSVCRYLFRRDKFGQYCFPLINVCEDEHFIITLLTEPIEITPIKIVEDCLYCYRRVREGSALNSIVHGDRIKTHLSEIKKLFIERKEQGSKYVSELNTYLLRKIMDNWELIRDDRSTRALLKQYLGFMKKEKLADLPLKEVLRLDFFRKMPRTYFTLVELIRKCK